MQIVSRKYIAMHILDIINNIVGMKCLKAPDAIRAEAYHFLYDARYMMWACAAEADQFDKHHLNITL